MSAAHDPAGLELSIGAGDSEPEELERLTAALQRELLDVRAVDDVSRPPVGPPPLGTRAVDPVSLGMLVVSLAKSAGGLRAVTRVVQSWLASQPSRSVKLQLDGDSLELTGVSAVDQERLVTAWIKRHAQP